MVQDVLANVVKQGMTKSEIAALLGNPDRVFYRRDYDTVRKEGAEYWYYDFKLTGEPGVFEGAFLVLVFDKDGKYISNYQESQ